MKIVLLGSAYPYRGGIAHFTEALAMQLQTDGHEVEIITFTRQYPEKLFPGTTQFDTTNRTPKVKIARYIDSLNPRSWVQTAQIIADTKPNVVIFQHWLPFFAPAFGIIARKLRKQGISTMAVIHNALPHEKRFGDVSLSKFFFKACEKFVVLAKESEIILRKLGMKQPIVFHPHPIYDLFGDPMPQIEARKQLNLSETAPTLLFFGLIRTYKGLLTLLDAMPQVLAQIPKMKLVVAGEFYEAETTYISKIAELGLAENVLLHTHYIPNEQIPLYFSAADVIVQPYQTATQSGVTQIALHFEKPSIVTNVGALPDMVQHEQNGFVVPPNDPHALSNAIIRFFQENCQTQFSASVKAQKALFSWENFTKMMIEN